LAEATVERSVVAIAERAGWLVRKVAWLGRRGAPDRLFAKGGRVVLIEFKAPLKEPRIQQEREIRRLQLAGIEVHACNDIGMGCKILGINYVEAYGGSS
jgi:hypothetical protein